MPERWPLQREPRSEIIIRFGKNSKKLKALQESTYSKTRTIISLHCSTVFPDFFNSQNQQGAYSCHEVTYASPEHRLAKLRFEPRAALHEQSCGLKWAATPLIVPKPVKHSRDGYSSGLHS